MGVVVEGGSVEANEFDVMGDEDDKAPPASVRSVAAKKGVIGESRIFGCRAKFCLLQASNLDIVFDKVTFEFPFRCVDSVDVELEKIWRRGLRTDLTLWTAVVALRARMRMDVAGDD